MILIEGNFGVLLQIIGMSAGLIGGVLLLLSIYHDILKVAEKKAMSARKRKAKRQELKARKKALFKEVA